MDFSLFYKILYYWLCNNLICWYLYSFCSCLSIILWGFCYSFHFYSLIWLSLELYIYIFSLNYWLYICLIVDFFTRSSNSLSSCSFLKNWLSHNRLSIFIFWFSLLKFNSFCVINNLSLYNRLSINFFSRCLNSFINNFFGILNRSSLNRTVINLSLTSINLKLYIFSQNSRLNILFSNGGFSRYINRYSFNFSFTINNRFFIFSFGIYRSRNDLFSNDRSLNNSLFNDRLLYNSLCNDRLRDNLSSNNRFRDNLLSLSNNRFRIKYFITNNLLFSTIRSGFGLKDLSLSFYILSCRTAILSSF